MSSLFKRKGVYYYQWYVSGKQHKKSLKTDDKIIAQQRARVMELKVLQNSYGINTFKTTVRDCLLRFLDAKKSILKNSTYICYVRAAKILDNFIGFQTVCTLNNNSLLSYIDYRKKRRGIWQDYSRRTVYVKISFQICLG